MSAADISPAYFREELQRSSLGLLSLMAATLSLGTEGGHYSTVNDIPPKPDKTAPEYNKTPDDLARIEAARLKRERRAAKKRP